MARSRQRANPRPIPTPAARKDAAQITADGQLLAEHLAGVRVHEVKNVVTSNGIVTEVFRTDWGILSRPVEQVLCVSLAGNAVSAWHLHRRQTDHIFAIAGVIRVVLHDPRAGSLSRGRTEVFHLSPMRPLLLGIPPGLWHGIQNLTNQPATFVNLFDRAYVHADPDEWRLPTDTKEIPYRFERQR